MPPVITDPLSAARDRGLWCWVQGDDGNAIFHITIKGTDTVDQLKTLIKQTRDVGFDKVAAHKLKLWKVSRLDE
jgi:hypothetical protein